MGFPLSLKLKYYNRHILPYVCHLSWCELCLCSHPLERILIITYRLVPQHVPFLNRNFGSLLYRIGRRIRHSGDIQRILI